MITGASDDDPSGISTYSVAGATTGLSMLWLAFLSTPMMAVIQGMCARIGMVTGEGLAVNIRKSIPTPLAYLVAIAVIVANTFNAGADFAGMAASANMVVPQVHVLIWVVFFGALLLLSILFLSYRVIAATFKWLTISLFSYAVTAFWVKPDWGMVAKAFVTPHIQFSRDWITTMVGVLGTTITPYLFFWQSALEVEEEKEMGRTTLVQRRGATPKEISDAHFDVNTGMIFSNVIMAFIIITTALTLYVHHKTHIATAQDAARALEPLAGHFASLLFTLGIVGTGLLAIPALVGSSAYVVAELFKFRRGSMNERPSRAKRFYGVFAAGLLIGVAMCFARVDPIRALYYAAVLNGVVAVPLIFLIIRIASNSGVMGKWQSSLLSKAWAWLAFILMGGAAVAMFVL
ncbi:MAG TPA: divalent metal cation transporter [Candidatus Rubrimentiphilum sp.]|nr:divalent metal cation transporter [Candidatus Rubrimentiphilum sp.]